MHICLEIAKVILWPMANVPSVTGSCLGILEIVIN